MTANPNSSSPVQAVEAAETTCSKFQITNAKLYIPPVIWCRNENIKLLEKIKKAFKRTIYRNKDVSEITTQPKNSNLDYMIDPTLKNACMLFVLSFRNGDDDPKRDSFDKYYVSLVEIKDFNALIFLITCVKQT